MSPLSVVSNSTSSVVTHTYLSYKLIWYVTCQSDELLYQKWQGSTTVKSFKFVGCNFRGLLVFCLFMGILFLDALVLSFNKRISFSKLRTTHKFHENWATTNSDNPTVLCHILLWCMIWDLLYLFVSFHLKYIKEKNKNYIHP